MERRTILILRSPCSLSNDTTRKTFHLTGEVKGYRADQRDVVHEVCHFRTGVEDQCNYPWENHSPDIGPKSVRNAILCRAYGALRQSRSKRRRLHSA